MKDKMIIPKAKGVDNTLSLIREGYHFLPSRHKELESPIFVTRLMGKKAVCIQGEEAAKIFYDEKIFKRKGAAPKPLQKSLLGEGGVHGQDGEEHRQRKRMFLSMMTPERLEEMVRLTVEELDAKAAEWETKESIIFLDEIEEVLSRAVYRWAGLPIEEREVEHRTREIADMVDSFGGSVTRFNAGRKARQSQEKWLREIIKMIRSGKYDPPAATPAYIVANHRVAKGRLLKAKTAAVELNNAYRPLIASAYLLTLGILALHEFPEIKEKLSADQNHYSHLFTQEVRRFYPFAPAMAAKVKRDFTWKSFPFKKNTLVVLDIFGTNRHPDSWENPDVFIPERFENWKGNPYSFLPQGGGDYSTGHRCPGEWATIMVMKAIFRYMTQNITYEVPDQDLTYTLNRMPTMPNSGMILTNIRKQKKSVTNIISTEWL